MGLKLNDISKRKLKKIIKALKQTENMGCPPDKYRDTKHTECFYCNECWQYAIKNKLND